MSAYNHQVTTKMTELDCLKKALEKTPSPRNAKQTFKPVLHNIAKPLEGYHGDKRQEKAELIIPRSQVGSASNEIGFKKQADGTIKAIISAYDHSCGYDEGWLKKVATNYNEVRGTEKLTSQFDVEEVGRAVLPNGKVRVQFAYRGN